MKIIAKIVAAAAFTAVASSASAADLSRPVYKGPAPVAVAAYNWTGFYLGAHGGYAWGDLNANLVGFTGSREIDGFFGGGQVGWNWQAAGSPWVWGIEADISFGNIEDSVTTAGVGSFSSEATSFGTVRGRVGYAVDRALWYVTGGFAWVDNEINLALTGIGAFNSSNTHVGWTIGGGLEFALADAWTAKIEYLYIDVDSENYFTNIVGPGLAFDPDFHTVRVGLNYRFGGGKGPVVAKY
ncbi:MAG TPA: outer membrane protein [Pseudorhodoplanes sp.]|nr:outer membrane protein [Pseudorhodoplanes sp.]